MKNVLILQYLHNPDKLESYSTFTGLCKHKNLPYNYLKGFDYPIIYKEYRIFKLPVISVV